MLWSMQLPKRARGSIRLTNNSQNSEASKFFFFLRRGFAIKDVSIFIQPEEKKKKERKKPRRKHWHKAGKGLIALIYKELLPINKREAFIKKTMDKR